MLDSGQNSGEGSAAALAEHPPRIALRVVSGIGGTLVLFVAAVLTLGTALAAPVGMLLVRRWAVRRNRYVTRVASWFGAALASSVAVALVCVVLISLLPRGTFREIRKTTVESQAHPVVTLPRWYTRAFPQAAASDSLTHQLVRSPAFVIVSGTLGLVIASAFCGTIAGTMGWVASMLLSYAVSGRSAA